MMQHTGRQCSTLAAASYGIIIFTGQETYAAIAEAKTISLHLVPFMPTDPSAIYGPSSTDFKASSTLHQESL
jgi:hypothetical protein